MPPRPKVQRHRPPAPARCARPRRRRSPAGPRQPSRSAVCTRRLGRPRRRAIASRQASTPSRWASRSAGSHSIRQSRARAGVAASAPASQSGIGAPDRLSYHHWASRSRRSTQSVQPPRGRRDPGLPPVGCRVGVGQVADPAAADRRAARPCIGAPEVSDGQTANASGTSTGCTETLGAITASEPNHSPVSAAGGGSSSRLVASPTARSTRGAPPRSPSRSIRTALA